MIFFSGKRDILSRIPHSLQEVARTLGEKNYQAYLVGGALRDILQKREVMDWDLATDAQPYEVEALFSCTVPVGRRYGTLLLVRDKRTLHISSFRGATIQEDLGYRDFTINSLAFDLLQNRLLDPFHGRRDLKRRLLRGIWDPEDRFLEDPLRMLRLFRFVGQLDFQVERETQKALMPSLIQRVKVERILEEMNHLLLSPSVDKGLLGLFSSGLLHTILPEFRCLDGEEKILTHIFKTTAVIKPTLVLRWAAFLHDLGKGETKTVDGRRVTFHGHARLSVQLGEEIMTRLRLPKRVQREVLSLIEHHMFPLNPAMSDRALLRLIKRVGRESIEDLLELRRADIIGTTGRFDLAWEGFSLFSRRIQDRLADKQPFSVKDLAIDGRDVMQILDEAEGPRIGLILDELLEWVMQDKARNKKERLESYLKERGLSGEETTMKRE